MTPDYPDNVAIVCHDAGAANIVIAGLLETRRSNWHAYMRGPAEKLWNMTFPEVALYDGLESTLDGTQLLITGTGWQSDIEHEARRLAKLHGIYSVAVIDHWVNYEERFIRNNDIVWPDEFWVTDDYAMELAEKAFPIQKVTQVPNYYINAQLQGIGRIDASSQPELLYILEPMRSDWGRGIAGEFQALDYFVSHLPQLKLPSSTVIRLRPHPSDELGKYDDWVAAHHSLNIQVDESVNITESLKKAKWVVGCESFGLVLALLSGRKVYCTLPPWAPVCRLPHDGLLYIGDE